MDKKSKNFRDLRIWNKGIEIVCDTYDLTNKFPRSELYGLVSQLRRSAVSIPSNIAEGFKRFHDKEYKQFLYITLGSSAELETQLEISAKLNYIKTHDLDNMREKIDHLSKMISVLIKKLR